MRYVLVLTALLIPSSIAAQGFFSRTCLTYQTTEYCASIDASVGEDPRPEPSSTYGFYADLHPLDATSILHTTAFAFYVPFPVTALDGWSSSSGWGAPLPFGALPPSWHGYHLFAGLAVSEPKWYLSGEGYSGEAGEFVGWTEPTLPEGLLWAWRAENEDGSVILDCFQQRGGVDRCATVVPEPATWALLLTGLVVLALIYRRRTAKDANVTEGVT